MNVSLAKKMLKLTPKHIFSPTPSLDTPLPLSTGSTIPAVGYAAWQASPEPDEVRNAVASAIKAGYRHFDISHNNEVEAGETIKAAIVSKRVKGGDVFVTARLGSRDPGNIEAALDSSLRNLAFDYVDLFVIEYDETTVHQSWQQMEQLRGTNKTKAIGIANINAEALQQLLSSTKSIPTVVQVDCNPYDDQDDLVHLCHDKIIHATARSPFRDQLKGSLFNHNRVLAIADKHGAVPEKVLLSWHLARGSSVLVEDVILGGSEGHRDLLQLDADDMAVLDLISG